MDNLRKGILIHNNVAVGAVGDKYFSSTAIGVIQAFSGNIIPRGFLVCNGASYKVADYPDLYAVIGNTYGGDTENFNVPDYRETVLVGVGENTTDTIASHDVYELGEFKDDQLQRITGDFEAGNRNTQPHTSGAFSTKESPYTWFALSETATSSSNVEFDSSKVTRSGTTTHSKQKGVTYIIKAFHTNEGVDSGVYTGVKQVVTVPLISLNATLSAGSSTQIFWDNSITVDSLTPSGTILRWRYIVTGVSQASGQLSIGGGTASLKNDETSTACAYPKVTNWIDTHLDGLANLVPSVTLYAKTVSIQIEYIA